MKRVVASWWIAAVMLAVTAQAERIRYFCNPGSSNEDSTGSAMGGGFQFELGVFDVGFTPAVSNRHDWLDHWNAAQATSYDAGNDAFTDELEISDNNAPFVIGASAWIFGRRTTPTGSEWLLFRSSTWLWPEVFPFSPEALQWNTSDADVVLLGQVDGDGSPFLMKSEAVQDFSQWQLAELSGETLDGVDEDADADGVANIVEFFSGTDPLSGTSRPEPTLEFTGPGGPFLRATYPMDPGSLVVAMVEASGGLSAWDATGVTLEISGNSLLATDSVALGAGTRRFLRLRVELP